MKLLSFLLFPFALIYGIITLIRNKFFDWGILKSTAFNFPIISVGNLTVGGTGKTPQIEYLVRLLKNEFNVATLSRGYGRKTSGFVLATDKSTAIEIGDEPVQFKQKFKNLIVAVDENRVEGVIKLKQRYPSLDAVLLDDAYQHRYIKPGLSILLTDFHRLYADDYLLPMGKLREIKRGARRADIIIVTKTGSMLSPITARRINGLLRPRPDQKLYFSYIGYGPITPIPGAKCQGVPKKVNSILLFAGIANIYPIVDHISQLTNHLEVLNFGDHHNYSSKDMQKIRKKYDDIFTKNKIIVTTEKDVMRLFMPKTPSLLTNLPVYYIPIKVKIHKTYKKEFNDQVINYVRENTANS
nr:tetraacyldisaccharide 4'-kinase [Bacteroidota bacterium]